MDVLSNGKVYKRPVGKLSLLPIKDEDQQKDSNDKSELKVNDDHETNDENEISEENKTKPSASNICYKINNAVTMIMLVTFFGLIASIAGEHSNFNVKK